MDKIIGIGEFAVSDDNKCNIIKTHALSSCVAVVVYNSKKRAAGMVHIALPNPFEGSGFIAKPGYYATTGIPLMINTLCRQYSCNKKELKVHIMGGADSNYINDMFHIGKRNIIAVKRTLSEMEMIVHTQEIGGNVSRTVEINLSTGKINIYTLPIKI